MSAGNIVPITDMTAQGIALLIPEYQETPLWQAWIASFLDATQNLETATADVWAAALDLDGAVGAQLDLVGQLLVEDRDGRTDDDYRRSLKVRVLINKSQGTTEQLIQIGDLFADVSGEVGAYIRIQDLQPARIEYRIVRTPVAERGETDKRLRNAKAAGVAIQTLLHPGGPGGSFRFSDVTTYPEKNTAQGFARADKTAGGALADIFQVRSLPFSPLGYGPDIFLHGSYGVTTDGFGVTAWADQSPNALDAAQSINNRKPAYSVSNAGFNGKGTIDGDSADGAADFMSTAAATSLVEAGGGCTQYVVFSCSASGGVRYLATKWSTENVWILRIWSTGEAQVLARNAADTAWYTASSGVIVNDDVPRLMVWGWDPAGTLHCHVSGGVDVTRAAPTMNTGLIPVNVYGNRYGNSMSGSTALFAHYPEWHSPTQRARMEAWILSEFGVSL